MGDRAGPGYAAADVADFGDKRRLAIFACRKGVCTKFLEAIKVSIHIWKAAFLQLTEGRKSWIVAHITEVKVGASMRRWRDFHAEITTLALSKSASDDGVFTHRKAQALLEVVEYLLDIRATAYGEELSNGVMDSRA